MSNSVLAIISKAMFAKMVPENVKVGDLVKLDRYLSKHQAFDNLSADDAIFLVTVRPPSESLWLVAILQSPKRSRSGWLGRPNTTRIADVTAAIPQLTFSNGQGLAPKKGALGMSLQTPRLLTANDAELLRGTVTSKSRSKGNLKVEPKSSVVKTSAPAWSTLKVASGPARKIPALLRALHTSDRYAAVDELASLLTHNGRLFSGSAPAITALLAELETAQLVQPERILQLVMHVFLMGDGDWFQKLVFGRQLAKLDERYSKGAAKAVRNATVAGVPTFLRLLRSKDPRVRDEAAFALAHVGPSEAVDAVSKQLEERVPELQASAIVACIYLAYRNASISAVVREQLDSLSKRKTHPLVRGLALVGSCALADRAPHPDMHDDLVAFFAAAAELQAGTTLWIGGKTGPTTPFRWNAGAADVIALRMLGEGSRAGASRLVLARALAAAWPTIAKIAAPARWDWPIAILGWYFSVRNLDTDPVTPADLDPTQRKVLGYLSERGVRQKFANHSPFVGFGLPPDARSRRRLLGLEPAGVLEQVVHVSGGARMARWRVLTNAFAEYDRLRESRKPPLQTFVEKRLPDTSARDWLDIWSEVEVGAYFLDPPYDPHPDRPLLAAMDKLPDTEVLAWSRDVLDELVANPDEERMILGYLALLAQLRRIPKGKLWNERYDIALTLYGEMELLKEVLSRMPAARRDRLIKRQVGAAELDGTICDLRQRADELKRVAK